jgi:hypothetical protein
LKLVMVALKLVEVGGLGGCVVDVANFHSRDRIPLQTVQPSFKTLSFGLKLYCAVEELLVYPQCRLVVDCW